MPVCLQHGNESPCQEHNVHDDEADQEPDVEELRQQLGRADDQQRNDRADDDQDRGGKRPGQFRFAVVGLPQAREEERQKCGK